MEKAAKAGITGFFTRERAKILNYIRGRIADEAGRDAEDVMQDVMVKLVDSADVKAPIEDLAAYIYAAIRNRIIDIMRRRKPQQSLQEFEEKGTLELADVLGEAKSPDKTLESDEFRGQVWAALEQLSPGEREIIIATEFEEITFRELAEELEIPINTLLSRKARALEKIRKILIKGGNENGK